VRTNTVWRQRSSATSRLLAALGGPGAVTLLAIPDRHPETTIVAVLYVLAVMIAARVGGAVTGIAASIVSFLALNFFFTEPLHTFKIASAEDLVSLVVFLLASLIVGVLLSSALEAKARSERRELEARLVNRMATRLLGGETIEDVLADLARGLREVFDLRDCEIATTLRSPSTGTGDEDAGDGERIPLSTGALDLGYIRLCTPDGQPLSEDQRGAVRSIATQVAVALEGRRLSEQVRAAELEAQASQLKAALFSGVTHDVKTPLAAITAAVTSLTEGKEFPESTRREHLETIKQEAERLHRVVNNLLDVARLRAGALVPAKTPTPIDELMESVLNRLRPALRGREVEIRVGDDVPEVPMDVVQIDQVLTNLIENAVKFTPPGSPVSLVAVGSRESIRVTVADRGPGIAKEDRSRVLEPFERGHGSPAGTGLGLAICNAIVVAHGGRMWISDNPQGGAAFTFELPCTSEGAAAEVSHAPAGARR
jgi:two-component system sensor histidine kinase KdpD